MFYLLDKNNSLYLSFKELIYIYIYIYIYYLFVIFHLIVYGKMANKALLLLIYFL